MAWDVEYTDEFGAWWDALTAAEQIDVGASVRLLEAHGPTLGYPYSSGVESSQHGHMRELRIQHQGRPYRVLVCLRSQADRPGTAWRRQNGR